MKHMIGHLTEYFIHIITFVFIFLLIAGIAIGLNYFSGIVISDGLSPTIKVMFRVTMYILLSADAALFITALVRATLILLRKILHEDQDREGDLK